MTAPHSSRASAECGDIPAGGEADTSLKAAPPAGPIVETGHDIGVNCAAAAEVFPQHTKQRQT